MGVSVGVAVSGIDVLVGCGVAVGPGVWVASGGGCVVGKGASLSLAATVLATEVLITAVCSAGDVVARGILHAANSRTNRQRLRVKMIFFIAILPDECVYWIDTSG
jgi:hypothetical protein